MALAGEEAGHHRPIEGAFTRGRGGRIRVLHLEDDPGFADLTEDCLKRHVDGLEIVQAHTVEQGLELLEEHDIDCILSDYDLPDDDGLDFLKAVRSDHCTLPFILFTGKGSEEIASEAISAGVTDYFQKHYGISHFEVLANRILNVIEQWQASKAVEETEAQLQAIAEHSNDLLWMSTGNWDELLFVNTPYEELLGRPIDELHQDPTAFMDGIHPEDRPQAVEAMERLSSGESVDQEFRVKASEDYRRWVWFQGKPIVDESGEVSKVVGFARDITDRKRRERNLECYRKLFETVSDPMYVVDADGFVTNANTALADHLGVERAAVLGSHASEWVCEVDVDRGRELLEELGRDSDRSWGAYEITVTPATGDPFPAEVSIAVLRDDAGRRQGNVGVVRDISARKEREAALQRERDKLQLLLEQLPNPVIFGSAPAGDPMIAEVNPAFEEVFGYDADEVVGENLDELIVPDDADNEELNHRVIEEGSVQAEVRRRTAYGLRDFHLQTAVTALGDTDDADVEGWAIYTDITGQKRRERELQRQNEQLEEFAKIVSHDLRNPLGVAKGRVNMANEERENEHLEAATRSLDRMEELIDDLLDLAQAGKTIEAKEPVDIGALVDECWRTMQSDEVTLINTATGTVRADRSRFQQLLENLFQNAMVHAGDDVTVEVGVTDDGGLYVEDDGSGLPPNTVDQLFDAGHSTMEQGTGFGLTIVQEIAEAHGWNIEAGNGEERGARFTISGMDLRDGSELR